MPTHFIYRVASLDPGSLRGSTDFAFEGIAEGRARVTVGRCPGGLTPTAR